jgi:hypothetical protein
MLIFNESRKWKLLPGTITHDILKPVKIGLHYLAIIPCYYFLNINCLFLNLLFYL